MTDEYTPTATEAKIDPARCKAGVWSAERWSTLSQCARKPVKDGWCKQHHPETEASRLAAATTAAEIRSRGYAMGYYGERFMAALIKIRNGDDPNPQDTAMRALKDCQYANEDRT